MAMKIVSAEFLISAVKAQQYPDDGLPEIAFAGRSNVGKSSLINTLLNRKRLVKTSSTPGKTQLINFFSINREFLFVDLPGYGYAKVPMQLRRQWKPMIETYLTTRSVLKGLVLLLDIRRNPGSEEIRFLQWLRQQRLASILVLTKVDKLSKNKQGQRQRQIESALCIPASNFILFSAKSRQGKQTLWRQIEPLLGMA